MAGLKPFNLVIEPFRWIKTQLVSTCKKQDTDRHLSLQSQTGKNSHSRLLDPARRGLQMALYQLLLDMATLFTDTRCGIPACSEAGVFT
jgi:hypothetical protein